MLTLDGNARVTCVDEDGHNFIADVKKGDPRYFRSGLLHSIQALDQGCEFLLVFDNGVFSEDNNFPLRQRMSHVPNEVHGKDIGEKGERLRQYFGSPALHLQGAGTALPQHMISNP